MNFPFSSFEITNIIVTDKMDCQTGLNVNYIPKKTMNGDVF